MWGTVVVSFLLIQQNISASVPHNEGRLIDLVIWWLQGPEHCVASILTRVPRLCHNVAEERKVNQPHGQRAKSMKWPHL